MASLGMELKMDAYGQLGTEIQPRWKAMFNNGKTGITVESNLEGKPYVCLFRSKSHCVEGTSWPI